MANIPPIPDLSSPAVPAPSVEVLLAGNIADDDLLWVVLCDPSELARLVLSPVEWVAALGGLPGWAFQGSPERAPAPTLARDFAMAFRTVDDSSFAGRIVVQGISGTNALTVRLGPTSLGPIVGDPKAFWDAVSTDAGGARKRLPTSLLARIHAAYAHFEILDRSHTALERALRTARYLAAAALDPSGHAAMLARLDQEPLAIGALEEAPAMAAAPANGESPGLVRFSQAREASVLYANVEQAPGNEDPNDLDGDDMTQNCSAISGNMDDPGSPPDVTITDIVVKRYGGFTTIP